MRYQITEAIKLRVDEGANHEHQAQLPSPVRQVETDTLHKPVNWGPGGAATPSGSQDSKPKGPIQCSTSSPLDSRWATHNSKWPKQWACLCEAIRTLRPARTRFAQSMRKPRIGRWSKAPRTVRDTSACPSQSARSFAAQRESKALEWERRGTRTPTYCNAVALPVELRRERLIRAPPHSKLEIKPPPAKAAHLGIARRKSSL